MTEITIVTPTGDIRLETGSASSLMQVLVGHGTGIVAAECGGAAACATCHVYLDAESFGLLPAPSRAEADMLDFVSTELRPTSRLSCQVPCSALTARTRVEIPQG